MSEHKNLKDRIIRLEEMVETLAKALQENWLVASGPDIDRISATLHAEKIERMMK